MNERSTVSRAMIGAGLVAVMLLGACGWGGGARKPVNTPTNDQIQADIQEREGRRGRAAGSIFDLFKPRGDQGQIGAVNKYIWDASLEVLNFLPVETVDPFSGVISTGYGVPPGGGQAYRATILITDPALDARSLNLSLQTRNGPAAASTVRAVEDAILTRARQLRARDSRI
ncbi:DUF3576 domain-containing protein [Sagittula salina]|uniref:DUF3576 domain-containing protein n=1 Tax=Sagittula salina TaxID=2820268 RepID=A0A940MQ11_9RHOB|nr:DUF3576 domain-containing protein [Sagittula salina]MBP0483735.1 DUF3576 domain-containing protein [Sagittula salina]